MEKVLDRFIFFIGIFSTFQAIVFNIKSFDLTLLNILILGFALLKLYDSKKKNNRLIAKLDNNKLIILLLFLIFFISSTFSLLYVEHSWAMSSIKTSLKYLLILLPIIFVLGNDEIQYYKKIFLKGLLISAYIQLIWESIEIVLWNVKGLYLDKIIFGDFMKVKNLDSWENIVKIGNANFFRPTGISWDSSNLSLTLNIGFALTDSLVMKTIFALGIVCTGSRTGIIILFFNILLSILFWLKKIEFKKFYKRNFKNNISIFIGIIICLILIIFSIHKITFLNNILSSIIDRMSFKYQKNDVSALTHMSYYILLPDVFKRMNFLQYIIGYGTGIAGYPFTKYYNFYPNVAVWSPESDFISILLGNGLLGFLIYYLFMIKNVIYNKNSKKNILILSSLIIGGIFYIYFRTTWIMLLSIMLFSNDDIKKSSKNTIGHLWNGYPEERMIINKANNYKYIKLASSFDIKILLFKILAKISNRFKQSSLFYNMTIFNYRPLWTDRVDILHLFNRIYYGNKNWVVTFENTIPTFDDNMDGYRKYSKVRIKYLTSENCKAILPMSNWAYRQTVALWKEVADQNQMKKLLDKTTIMQPPQEILITKDELSKKFDNINEEVRFVFVGREFWRKGGEILIQALDYIKKKHNIKLTVISKLATTSQAFNPKTDKEILDFINSNSDWITYYSELPNDKVINIFKNSHIGLLPTWFDTYGFSVIEMQACGCPVITSNTNALSEINNDDRGWVIDTQNIIDKIGSDYHNIDICNQTRDYMIDNLISCIDNALNRKIEIKEKAISAYQYILNQHSPQEYSNKMKDIYDFCQTKLR